MPTATISIASGSDDVFDVRASSADEWPPTGTVSANDSSTLVLVRKANSSGGNDVEAGWGYLKFATGAELPDDADIESATLRLQVTTLQVDVARNLEVYYYPVASWPITTGSYDYRDSLSETSYTPASTVSLGSLSTGQVDISLGNLSAISKTAETSFKIGISGGDPGSGNEDYFFFASLEHTTELEPRLIVVYSTGGLTPPYVSITAS